MDEVVIPAQDVLFDLAATREINELRARYAWHAARGDFESVVALFVPDGVFETLDEGVRKCVRGHAELRAYLLDRMMPGRVFPMLHNEIVVVEGDTAYGTCGMESRSADGKLVFSGYYHDRMRRDAGRWRFTERRYFTYTPVFERSGLDLDGRPETGLAALHGRQLGEKF